MRAKFFLASSYPDMAAPWHRLLLLTSLGSAIAVGLWTESAQALSADSFTLPEIPPDLPHVPESPTNRANLITTVLAVGHMPGATRLRVEPCLDVADRTVVGVGVHSVSEEWARVAAAPNCSHGAMLDIDRPLRFEHVEGEVLSIVARGAELQLPEVRLPDRAAGLPAPEHARAVALALRASDWLAVSARVVAGTPNKWALHHLLLVCTLVLLLSVVAVVLLQFCATAAIRARAARGAKL